MAELAGIGTQAIGSGGGSFAGGQGRLSNFPCAALLSKAGKRKWDKFLHTHKLYRWQTYEGRIAAFENAGEWIANPALCAAKSLYAVARCQQLRVLQKQLDAYRERIAALFTSPPDSGLFGSLPGAGAKLAPRLPSEIGSDRALHETAQGLQCLAGTAPVSRQSGQIHKVNLRRACNKNLRNAMHCNRLSNPHSPVRAFRRG